MRALLIALLLALTACQADTDETASDQDASSGTDMVSVDQEDAPPAFDSALWHTFEAGPFTVPAGSERFFCFSQTLTEDLAVDELVLQSKPVVHHFVFSQTTTPDPDGFFECDVLFQNNWVPVLVAGTGDASLTMPEGSGHVLKAGTQLTAQLHLLNATPEDVTETIPLHMRKMAEAPQYPVEVVVFGNLNIVLPPGPSDLVGNCESDSDMTLFSAFPHMHLLGRKMVVEVGPDPEQLTEVFRRDPYDFDDQRLEDIDLVISKGDSVRVTCGYDNDLDEVVTFGESSTSEMCFFIGFATGATHQFAGCMGNDTNQSSLIPEACGEDPPNDVGLGASCTSGGGECAAGLLCTEDIEEIAGPEVCIGVGCSGASDCGEGGVCCSIAAADGTTLCLPPSCLFDLCEPVL